MFNTTINNNEETVVAVTKEVQLTISPDKVTEMYDECMEEVSKTFVRKFEIKSDTVNGIVVEFKDDYCTNERITLTRFKINGREFIGRDLHQNSEQLSDGELFETFKKHYSNYVANDILSVIGQKLIRKNHEVKI